MKSYGINFSPKQQRCFQSLSDAFPDLSTGTPSEALCSQLQGPHQNSIGGWRLLDAGTDEPAIVVYLEKFNEYKFRHTVQEAEAETAVAAQACASR